MTGGDSMQRPRLTMQRCRAGDADAARALGGFAFAGDAPAPLLGAGPPRLAGSVDVEVWAGAAAPTRHGRHGGWQWRADEHWLWADLRASGDDLESLTRQAYAELFALLDAHGGLQLQRLWNYLRDINGEQQGLERYRRFNVGRQQAFLDAGRSAFAGAPAACALGLPAGAADELVISVLAGRTPCAAVENPRQVSAYDYPSDYGPRSPTFSRAARLELGGGRDALLVSGTASIVGHASVHEGDVQAQAREIVANLRALLQAASRPGGQRFELDRFACTVYLRRAGDLDAVRGVFEAAVGRDSPAARQAVYLHADICRSDLLVEIEAHCLEVGAQDGNVIGAENVEMD